MSDKNTNLKAIGGRISQIREKRGITQENLSEMLGIKREKLAKWETGLQDFKTQDIVDLSKVLKISSDYLLGLSDKPTNDKDFADIADYLNITLTAAHVLKKGTISSQFYLREARGSKKPCEFAAYFYNNISLFLEEIEKDIIDFFSSMPKDRFKKKDIEKAYEFRRNLMVRYFMFDKSLPNLSEYIDRLIDAQNSTYYSSGYFEINKIFNDFGDIDLEKYETIFNRNDTALGYFYFNPKETTEFPF